MTDQHHNYGTEEAGIEFSDRNICMVSFLDLLGFQHELEQAKTEDAFQAFVGKVLGIQSLFIGVNNSAQKQGVTGRTLRLFSDSFITRRSITANDNWPSTFGEELWQLGNFQATLHSKEVFIRGGVAFDFSAHEDYFLCPATLKASKLEEEVSSPFISIDQSLYDDLFNQDAIRPGMCINFHGDIIINYLRIGVISVIKNATKENQKREVLAYLSGHKNAIESALKKNIDTQKVYKKYLDLMEYHNRYIDMSNEMPNACLPEELRVSTKELTQPRKMIAPGNPIKLCQSDHKALLYRSIICCLKIYDHEQILSDLAYRPNLEPGADGKIAEKAINEIVSINSFFKVSSKLRVTQFQDFFVIVSAPNDIHNKDHRQNAWLDTAMTLGKIQAENHKGGIYLDGYITSGTVFFKENETVIGSPYVKAYKSVQSKIKGSLPLPFMTEIDTSSFTADQGKITSFLYESRWIDYLKVHIFALSKNDSYSEDVFQNMVQSSESLGFLATHKERLEQDWQERKDLSLKLISLGEYHNAFIEKYLPFKKSLIAIFPQK